MQYEQEVILIANNESPAAFLDEEWVRGVEPGGRGGGGRGHSLKFSRTLGEMFSTPALHYLRLSAESFSCKKNDMKMVEIDTIFFGFARCHHLELLALYLGTGLYLSPVGKWGWVCRWYLLWQRSIYMFPPYFLCVFFWPRHKVVEDFMTPPSLLSQSHHKKPVLLSAS